MGGWREEGLLLATTSCVCLVDRIPISTMAPETKVGELAAARAGRRRATKNFIVEVVVVIDMVVGMGGDGGVVVILGSRLVLEGGT